MADERDTGLLTTDGSWTFAPKKETCPNCGRVHVCEGVIVCGEGGKRVWEGCVECWGVLIRELPDRIELQRENARLRALLTERGGESDA